MTQPDAHSDHQQNAHRSGSRAGWVVMLVVGILLMLGSGGPLLGGIVLASVSPGNQSQYLSTGEVNLVSSAYAVTSPTINIVDRNSAVPLVHVLISARSGTAQPIFVGIARTSDVSSYLAGVHHTMVENIRAYPVVVDYRDVPGDSTPALPTDQDFWDQSASGSGTQRISWTLQPGDWTVVVMNADATTGIDADVSAGANSPVLVPIAVGLIAIGGLVFVAGLVLTIFGAIGVGRRRGPTSGTGAGAGTGTGTATGGATGGANAPDNTGGAAGGVAFAAHYPAHLTATLSPTLSRGLWLVKWILAIPHWIILWFLWIAFIVTTIIAGFAILFTGRYPRGLFDFNVGVLRWSWRVSYYSYSALGTDEYPPFSLDSTDYPADFTVEYPEHLTNGLVLVKSWLLAIPHLAIVAVLTGGTLFGSGWVSGSWRSSGGISLLGLLVFIAAVILLFTGRYQQPLFDLVMGVNRWVFRVLAYVALMRDEYPPFRLDQGGAEGLAPRHVGT